MSSHGKNSCRASVFLIGISTPSLGKYIAAELKNLNKTEGIRYQTTTMGTIIESDDIGKIFEASKLIINSIFDECIKNGDNSQDR